MSLEAELPGRKMTLEAIRMICLRYQVASRSARDKQVLEVGCGAGLGLNYLSRYAASVTAGDIATENLEYAKKYVNDRVELVCFDAHELPFDDDSFDVVAAMQVIFYLDTDRLLDECHRVLKNGGTLIVNLPNRERPYFRPSPLAKSYHSAAELLDALSSHGFNAEIFGAFPVPESTKWSAWQRARIIAGKVLNLLPGGKRVKSSLASATSGADTILGNDIGQYIDDGILEGMDIIPISHQETNHDYQILYAISKAR
jgi:SAM-dependent methyltransferase